MFKAVFFMEPVRGDIFSLYPRISISASARRILFESVLEHCVNDIPFASVYYLVDVKLSWLNFCLQKRVDVPVG